MLTGSQQRASLARVERLRADVRPQFRALLLAAWAAGHDIVVTQDVRDDAAQRALYAQGRTKPGPGATPARPLGSTVTAAPDAWSTPHGCACALDFAFWAGGKCSWSEALPWAAVGSLAEAQGLVWGGRWKTPDKPHVEHPKWRELRGPRPVS